jgi:hypothetical protein
MINSRGTGKIRLVWSRGLTAASKSGNVNPLVGLVTGATGIAGRVSFSFHDQFSY